MTEPTVATLPESKPASLWEDFIDVLYAPSRVFERRRGRGFGTPLLLLTLLLTLTATATVALRAPLRERQLSVQARVLRERGMNEQAISQARSVSERFGAAIEIVTYAVGPLIGVPIAALFLWGIANAFDGRLNYAAAGIISTYSFVPAVITTVLGAVLLLFVDPQTLPFLQQMTVGPVLLLDRDASPVLVAVLTRFGVAEIWGLLITVVGLRVLAKLPRGAAIGAAATSWALGTIVAVLFGLRAAASMGS